MKEPLIFILDTLHFTNFEHFSSQWHGEDIYGGDEDNHLDDDDDDNVDGNGWVSKTAPQFSITG